MIHPGPPSGHVYMFWGYRFFLRFYDFSIKFSNCSESTVVLFFVFFLGYMNDLWFATRSSNVFLRKYKVLLFTHSNNFTNKNNVIWKVNSKYSSGNTLIPIDWIFYIDFKIIWAYLIKVIPATHWVHYIGMPYFFII